MGKAIDVSSKKCKEIETLLCHSRKTQKEIAIIVGVSKSVVSRIKIKIDHNKPLKASRIRKCGRKKSTTSRTDRRIRDTCTENRKKSVAHLTSILNNEGIKVSKRTVRRRLAEEHLIARRPIKKPHLSEAMKKKRLQWARKHQNMNVEDWSRVSKNF